MKTKEKDLKAAIEKYELHYVEEDNWERKLEIKMQLAWLREKLQNAQKEKAVC